MAGHNLHLGASGARVEVHKTQAIKRGGDVERLHAQYGWLQEHARPGLVKAVDLFDNGYVMERLSPLPINIVRPVTLMPEIISVLTRDVWSQPAEVEPDWDAHDELIVTRCVECNVDRDCRNDLLIWSRKVRQLDLEACLTHGDPTFENTMLRDGQLVLIDPIPARPAVPDLRCVDVGKILQSCLGYERERYGPDTWFESIGIPRLLTTPYEQYAAEYWCAVHHLRLLPYMTDDVVKETMMKRLWAIVSGRAE